MQPAKEIRLKNNASVTTGNALAKLKPQNETVKKIFEFLTSTNYENVSSEKFM